MESGLGVEGGGYNYRNREPEVGLQMRSFLDWSVNSVSGFIGELHTSIVVLVASQIGSQ